jgi:RNA polymerase sigma-70 factor, ECF subfamily
LDPEGSADEQLLARFLEGEEHAFTELVRRHEDRIFALAWRMTGDRSDALEATQDTFVSLFRKARSFRGDAAFGTWLYRIGLNSCKDLLRKRSRLPLLEEEPSEPPLAPSSDLSERAVTRLDLAVALARLPEDYREAVVLHDLGGSTYEDIARLTDVPVGTVKSRISRGRRGLAQLLEPDVEPRTSKRAT